MNIFKFKTCTWIFVSIAILLVLIIVSFVEQKMKNNADNEGPDQVVLKEEKAYEENIKDI